ncbi:T cell receptor beta variable 6-1 [Merluccius polli]|nr:T cell receptor beta variable 6-1 [Merluccius polli]
MKGAKGIQIGCSHDDRSYVLMYWYQRKDDTQSLTLIGFGYASGAPNYENQFEERFDITRVNDFQGELVIKEAAESDSAVYYCAASTR